MKRVYFIPLFFLFPLLSSFAQFQFCEPSAFDGSSYFRFDFSNSVDCYNIEHEKFPLSMATSATFVSKYFDAQGGFSFQDEQASIFCNFFGGYTFDFGLTIGGVFLLNSNFYYDLARELDFSGALYIAYKTKKADFWKFCVTAGYGGIATWIEYKIRGEKKVLPAEITQSVIVDLLVMKKFLLKNTIWFSIHTFEQNKFIFGISPSFALGYSYDFSKNWRFYGDVKLNCLSFLTTLGAVESVEIKLGVCYNLPLRKSKKKTAEVELPEPQPQEIRK